MVSFDFDGIDDLMDDLKIFEIDCPECEYTFEVSVDDICSTVTCPHCKTKITLESK